MTKEVKIPVLEIEKLTISRDGIGIFVNHDGDTFYSGGAGTWTGISPEGALNPKCFPAASASAWLKVSFVSSTSDSVGTGYIPVFPRVDMH